MSGPVSPFGICRTFSTFSKKSVYELIVNFAAIWSCFMWVYILYDHTVRHYFFVQCCCVAKYLGTRETYPVWFLQHIQVLPCNHLVTTTALWKNVQTGEMPTCQYLENTRECSFVSFWIRNRTCRSTHIMILLIKRLLFAPHFEFILLKPSNPKISI